MSEGFKSFEDSDFDDYGYSIALPKLRKAGDFDSRFLTLERESPGSRRTSWWKFPLERLFDLFTIATFIADVTLHMLIAMQFYRLQHMTFFWINVALFLLSQATQSFLFVSGFLVSDAQFSVNVKRFLCIFPFAQLVPLIIFAYSFHWRWMDSLLRGLGLRVRPLNPVKRKGQFSGCTVEALAEALPQGILLVVALVMTDNVASPLAMASLMVSLLALASKGVLFAYSIDLWIRVFISWSFVVDALSFFATVVWLCPFKGQEEPGVPVIIWGRSVVTWWVYKESVLAALWGGMWVALCVCFAIKRKVWHACVLFALTLVLFVPTMVLLEGSKFWLLGMWLSYLEPSMPPNSKPNTKPCNHELFTWIFWFLDTTHTVDGVEVDPGFMEKHRLLSRIIVKMTKCKTDDKTHSRMLELTTSKSAYSFSALRQVKQVNDRVKGLLFNSLRRGESEELMWYCWRIFACCIVFPFAVLSSLLSLAFPLVMVCSAPFEAVPLLHRVASFALFASLLVWLPLGIKVLQCWWVRFHIFNLAKLSSLLVAADPFQRYLTYMFNSLRGAAITRAALPLPVVLSALVVEYAFDEK